MSLKRKTPLLRTAPVSEPKPAPGPRMRKCAICRAKFVPISSWAKVCGMDCAKLHAEKVRAQQKAKALRQERARDKAKREGMKTYPQLVREAQKSFNEWVRLRDVDLPCICCGRWPKANAGIGGDWDAGHYLSRGSHPHLKFDVRNVFKQLKGCNRPGGTTAAAFRIGVIARIGLEAVEALEADNEIRKLTHDDLRTIKQKYAALSRELKKKLMDKL